MPSESGVQGSIPLGWGTCYYFFHSFGWLGIPHRIQREMRMPRVPINSIHIEGLCIASLGGLKTKPTIWLSGIWALSWWDKAQNGHLPKLFYAREPLKWRFKLNRSVRLNRPVDRSDRRFQRFVAGLNLKQFNKQIGPELWPVDGWTGWTGRSGPVFKTLDITHTWGDIMTFFNYKRVFNSFFLFRISL